MAYGNGGSANLGGVSSAPFNPVKHDSNERATAGSELDGNIKRLSALSDLISQLEQRLSPVLSPSAPAGEAQGTPIQSGSAVVELLRRTGQTVEGLSARLQYIIDRIEL